jgi:hypothetical protein
MLKMVPARKKSNEWLEIAHLSVDKNSSADGGYNVAVYVHNPMYKVNPERYRKTLRQYGYAIPKEKIGAWISLTFRVTPSQVKGALWDWKYLLV